MAFFMAVLLLTGAASDDQVLRVGSFSVTSGDSPIADGWTAVPLGKNKPTTYNLIEEEGIKVVQAISQGSASGLQKAVDLDPSQYQTLKWRWKVNNVPASGNINKKKGDDVAARIFVTFEYDVEQLSFKDRLKFKTLKLLGYGEMPLRALNYVWANRAPAGTVTPNAYSDWVQMVVLRDGNADLATWHNESRNIYADYMAAFGESPGRIKNIVIMTDTDNTQDYAEAYFGDILLAE